MRGILPIRPQRGAAGGDCLSSCPWGTRNFAPMRDSRLRSWMLRPHMRACIALLLAAVFSAVAGEEALRRDFHFQVLGGEQGLAQNTVGALMQDHQGFLWVGTQG